MHGSVLETHLCGADEPSGCCSKPDVRRLVNWVASSRVKPAVVHVDQRTIVGYRSTHYSYSSAGGISVEEGDLNTVASQRRIGSLSVPVVVETSSWSAKTELSRVPAVFNKSIGTFLIVPDFAVVHARGNSLTVECFRR
jgi:hypothetical protein